MKKTYIGITGVARSGKNLLADLLIKNLYDNYGLKAAQVALATELKNDCATFIKAKLGLNVFTEKTEEKSQFRDLLVWYGDIMRKRTNGRYWIEKVNKALRKDKGYNVIIVSDIRYDFYEKDEVYWIKNELYGKLIHVRKFIEKQSDSGIEKVYQLPANAHEEKNDPLMLAKSDYKLDWKDVTDGKVGLIKRNDLLEDVYLNTTVTTMLDQIMKNVTYI